MKPDAILKVRFFTTVEGGRKGPVTGEGYRCPIIIEGEAFDCRFCPCEHMLRLGQTYEISIKFLTPDLALSKLEVGKSVKLWEGKVIGKAKVVWINDNT